MEILNFGILGFFNQKNFLFKNFSGSKMVVNSIIFMVAFGKLPQKNLFFSIFYILFEAARLYFKGARLRFPVKLGFDIFQTSIFSNIHQKWKNNIFLLKAFFSVLFPEIFSFSLNWLKNFFSDGRCICSQKTCILMKKSFLFSVTKVPIFWGKK